MCLQVDEFLSQDGTVFDVRSPAEYAHAHIPGAISLPLFNDEERAQVGTIYKRQGKEPAIRLGIQLVGPKLLTLYDAACQNAKIYCWRGGMRSGFVRHFLFSTGFRAVQLQGGYKAFRRKMLELFTHDRSVCVIGGFTGSGKTEVLEALKKRGQQIVDLEGLAQHRGSVYGALEHCHQPTVEQFENLLGMALFSSCSNQPLWLEHESRLIGSCVVPGPFFEAMKRAPLFVIPCSFEERVARICTLYADHPPEFWIAATKKLEKRLGGACAKAVIAKVHDSDLAGMIRLLLPYYDKAYTFAMSKHPGTVIHLPEYSYTPDQWAEHLTSCSSI